MSDELIEKVGRMNSQAIRQSLAGMEQKIQDMQDQHRSQQNTIGTCLNRILILENQLLMLRVMKTGTGPST
mgnify:FL=1